MNNIDFTLLAPLAQHLAVAVGTYGECCTTMNNSIVELTNHGATFVSKQLCLEVCWRDMPTYGPAMYEKFSNAHAAVLQSKQTIVEVEANISRVEGMGLRQTRTGQSIRDSIDSIREAFKDESARERYKGQKAGNLSVVYRNKY